MNEVALFIFSAMFVGMAVFTVAMFYLEHQAKERLRKNADKISKLLEQRDQNENL